MEEGNRAALGRGKVERERQAPGGLGQDQGEIHFARPAPASGAFLAPPAAAKAKRAGQSLARDPGRTREGGHGHRLCPCARRVAGGKVRFDAWTGGPGGGNGRRGPWLRRRGGSQNDRGRGRSRSSSRGRRRNPGRGFDRCRQGQDRVAARRCQQQAHPGKGGIAELAHCAGVVEQADIGLACLQRSQQGQVEPVERRRDLVRRAPAKSGVLHHDRMANEAATALGDLIGPGPVIGRAEAGRALVHPVERFGAAIGGDPHQVQPPPKQPVLAAVERVCCLAAHEARPRTEGRGLQQHAPLAGQKGGVGDLLRQVAAQHADARQRLGFGQAPAVLRRAQHCGQVFLRQEGGARHRARGGRNPALPAGQAQRLPLLKPLVRAQNAKRAAIVEPHVGRAFGQVHHDLGQRGVEGRIVAERDLGDRVIRVEGQKRRHREGRAPVIGLAPFKVHVKTIRDVGEGPKPGVDGLVAHHMRIERPAVIGGHGKLFWDRGCRAQKIDAKTHPGHVEAQVAQQGGAGIQRGGRAVHSLRGGGGCRIKDHQKVAPGACVQLVGRRIAHGQVVRHDRDHGVFGMRPGQDLLDELPGQVVVAQNRVEIGVAAIAILHPGASPVCRGMAIWGVRVERQKAQHEGAVASGQPVEPRPREIEERVVLKAPFGQVGRIVQQPHQFVAPGHFVEPVRLVEGALAREFDRCAAHVGQGVICLVEDIAKAGRPRQELGHAHRVPPATRQDQRHPALRGHHAAHGEGGPGGLAKIGEGDRALFQRGQVGGEPGKAGLVHVGPFQAFEIDDHEVARAFRPGRIAHRVMKALDLLCDQRKAQRVGGRGHGDGMNRKRGENQERDCRVPPARRGVRAGPDPAAYPPQAACHRRQRQKPRRDDPAILADIAPLQAGAQVVEDRPVHAFPGDLAQSDLKPAQHRQHQDGCRQNPGQPAAMAAPAQQRQGKEDEQHRDKHFGLLKRLFALHPTRGRQGRAGHGPGGA